MTDRELDALVAEKVMGYSGELRCRQYGPLGGPRAARECRAVLGRWSFDGTCPECGWRGQMIFTLPRYSSDIVAAWEVVEKMGLAVIPPRGEFGSPATLWSCGTLGNMAYWRGEILDGYLRNYAEADTAAKAICLAALRAVGVEA